MTIRRVACPACGAAANIPAGMAQVRCPACGHVWNAKTPSDAPASAEPTAAARPKSPAAGRSAAKPSSTSRARLVIGAVISGLVLLLIVGGMAFVLLKQPAEETTSSSAPVEPPADVPEEKPGAVSSPESAEPSYRIVELPESTRRKIYDDLRAAARTSTEQPLLIPQGTGLRQNMEGKLEQIFEREITRFAAIHDVKPEDIDQIIAEGDAKGWDPSPRSNAVRDGERVYDKDRSEGWERP